MPQRRRIAALTIQTAALLFFAIIVMILAALRSDTLTSNYACGWFTCNNGLFPRLDDENVQFAIFEFIHHWSIIITVVSLPFLILLTLITLRREDEAVMGGLRNTALLVLVQSFGALASTVISLLWQGPALHFMVISFLVVVAVGVVAWAMFSPNQDYAQPLFLGALVVISAIPLVAYISVFL